MSTSPPKVFGASTPTEMSSPVRYYTGIGSRETPQEVQETMKRCAAWLADRKRPANSS